MDTAALSVAIVLGAANAIAQPLAPQHQCTRVTVEQHHDVEQHLVERGSPHCRR